MKAAQFNKALEMATSKMDLPEMSEVFDGCALPGFTKKSVTLPAFAAFLRYQVVMLNGEVDQAALQEVRWLGEHRFEIVGEANVFGIGLQAQAKQTEIVLALEAKYGAGKVHDWLNDPEKRSMVNAICEALVY